MLRALALYTSLVLAANAATAGRAAAQAPEIAPQPASPSSALTGPDPAPPASSDAADAPGAAAAQPAAAAAPAAAPAGGAAPAAVDWQAARAGGLAKLVQTDPPAEVPDVAFTDLDGGTHRLADWRGKVVLVNFWATWCAPCREEMPSLDALQQARGGADFAVLTIASGRNPPEAVRKFMADEAITALPTLADPTMQLARGMGVMAMPVTVILDRDGREVARLTGDADWSSPAALALVDQLTGR